jgi:hypothetical protein
VATTTAAGLTPAYNVYQGIVAGNSVTFFGVPVLPPGTVGTSRVLRITNVRANANTLGGAVGNSTSQVIAGISASPSSSLPIQNAGTNVVGFVEAGLSSSVLKATDKTSTLGASGATFAQCVSAGKPSTPSVVALAMLNFSENFGTAFKVRQAAVAQNVPGAIYNSESNFILTVNGATAGLADWGTRLKAVFNNIPAGVSIYVSTTNITDIGDAVTAPAVGSTTTFAQLLASETAPSSNSVGSTIGSYGVNVNVAQVPIVNGTGLATWEVINTNPNTNESLLVGVYLAYTAAPGSNTPAPGLSTVNMSFAPTPTNGAFSATTGGTALTYPIPRFADTSTANGLLTINICQTALLFPFVTNQAGFDTGIAISNTSTDPFGSSPQNGTCTLNFYGASAPAALTTPTVPTATTYATLASTSAPGFQGYTIAVCNFQYAHGFAFISDVGARNLAMGYLALVVNNGTFLYRSKAPSAEVLGQ